MATTSNPFGGLFTDKTTQEIERSLRAHRGALTKITCYIDTAVNAATIMPTEKGCQELEQLKERMEIKTEEMEAGYDTLIELEPQEEKRFLEKKKEIIDIAVKAHARLLPAIARCHNPVTANRFTQETRDPQVRIREGLKPDRFKMDFTPVEFRKWKAQITTFFEASNLQHANMKEQHGYLHM